MDAVISNAGASYWNKSTSEVPEADFNKCFNVSVRSVFFSVPACVAALRERGGRAIINVASVAATRPMTGLVCYNASKGAVVTVGLNHGFCLALRR